MCNHKSPSEKSINKKAAKHLKARTGRTLADKKAHVADHDVRGRRNFLKMTGMAAVGSSIMLNGLSVSAFTPSKLLENLTNTDCGDRVLVLVRLQGGNDGLNTIVQRDNDEYYNIRPNLAVTEGDMWNLSDEIGMPNVMQDLQPLWEGGHMKVIHNVGYPEANYSHFRSSDIWASASDSDEVDTTGWIGRYLDNEFPSFATAPPVIPPALQIGVQTNMVFRSMAGNMALAISNPAEFYQIAASGELYDTTQLNVSLPNESELSFVRDVANSSFRYSETIRDAYNAGQNQVDYPNNDLAEEMGIVARLIKGNLGTKVYMVTIGGFDTHANQNPDHQELLYNLASSVSSFTADLEASGHAENVLVMSFSEFGRTIYENGSEGTDHGTGAPMLLFGKDIGSDFIGSPIDLLNSDEYGDPAHETDFRQAYATVLQDWLCADPDVVDMVLGNTDFPLINGLVPAGSPSIGSNNRAALLGHQPGTEAGTIDIKYSMLVRGNVRLQILDNAGHPLRTLLNEFKEKNSYTLNFKPSDFFLPPGQYIYRLETGGRIYARGIKW